MAARAPDGWYIVPMFGEAYGPYDLEHLHHVYLMWLKAEPGELWEDW